MPKMIVSIDGVVIKEVQLTKDRTTLGRRPYNDIVIDNLAVSGEHAVLQHSEKVRFPVVKTLPDDGQRFRQSHATAQEARQAAEESREGEELRAYVVAIGHVRIPSGASSFSM